MKKHITILLTLLMLMISLISCQNSKETELPEGAIPVLSNYPNLSYILPSTYDTSKYEDGIWTRNGYSTYVTVIDGKLAVMPNHTNDSSSAPYVSKSTVYTFENVKGDVDGVYIEGALTINKPCVGMVHSYSKDKLLVFTTENGNGIIHLFERNEGSTSFTLSEQTISIDGEIYLVYFDWENMNADAPEELYVITSKNVVILKTNSFLNTADASLSAVETVSLQTPDWWQYIRPTNATKIDDGTVFVGEREGVIGIDPDGSIKYYPIDYTKAIYDSSK